MIYVYIIRKNPCGQCVIYGSSLPLYPRGAELLDQRTQGVHTSVHGTDESFVAYSKCGQNYILTGKVFFFREKINNMHGISFIRN